MKVSKIAASIICIITILMGCSGCEPSENQSNHDVPPQATSRNLEAEESILEQLSDATRQPPVHSEDVNDAYTYFRPMIDPSDEEMIDKAENLRIRNSSFEGDEGTIDLEYELNRYRSKTLMHSSTYSARLWIELKEEGWAITKYKVTL